MGSSVEVRGIEAWNLCMMCKFCALFLCVIFYVQTKVVDELSIDMYTIN